MAVTNKPSSPQSHSYLGYMVAAVRQHLSMPLYKNGYALVTSSLLTSALGMVYWFLAARLFSAESIGLSSALLSAMTFIVNLAHLNLPNGLNRFVPIARKQTKLLILGSYLVVSLIAGVTALIFVIGTPVWSPALAFVSSNFWLGILFIYGTIGWSIFVLQDSALTGLRKAVWVPIENLVFAVGKIILLLVLFSFFPNNGVFISWVIPVFLLIPIINWLIFRKILPAQPALKREPTEAISVNSIGRFIFVDYIASIVWMGTTNLLPLLVLQQLGAAANAWFYLTWNIAYSLYLVSRSMGMSFVTEGATNKHKLYELAFQTLKKSLLIVAPAALFIFFSANLILQFYGEDYAIQTTRLMRLFAIAAVPGTAINIYIGLLRVQRKMIQLVLILTTQGGLILGTSLLWIPKYGLNGIGFGWLLTHLALALFVLLIEPKMFFAPIFKNALHFLKQVFGRISDPHSRLLPETANRILFNLLPTIQNPEIPQSVVILNQIPTSNDVSVYSVGLPDSEPSAILKVTRYKKASSALLNHARTVIKLEKSTLLSFKLPHIYSVYNRDNFVGVLEKKLAGMTLKEYINSSDSQDLNKVLENISNHLDVFYAPLEQKIIITEQDVHALIKKPISLIRKEMGWLSQTFLGSKLNLLEQELSNALSRKSLFFAPIHGDLSPGNILVDPETGKMTGLIDWETAETFSYPAIDLYHLLLTINCQLDGAELGETVLNTLDSSRRFAEPVYLFLSSNDLSPNNKSNSGQHPDRVVILLAWLHHIKVNLEKSETYTKHTYWLFQNVIRVLFFI